MAEITQELIQSLFNYNNGNLYWKESRGNQIKIGDRSGTLGKTGYYQINLNYKTYRTHRLIYLYHYGYLPKYIDHIDGNKLNNNIENLREVTLSQNLMNQKPQINCSSIYKGVSWHKVRNKWRVYITINKKQIYLGSSKSEIDAAKAYNKAAMKYFKEFAYLNEVE